MNTALATESVSPDPEGAACGRCYHCGLPVDDENRVVAVVDGTERAFCCTGCSAVCQAIHSAGLEGFYRRTPEGEILGPPPEPPKDMALYDLDEVQSEYVGELGEEREIQLLVEGIHCAACVWLIERGLESTPGVEQARVNLTGKRLTLRWHNAQASLSSLLERLANLGYAAVPFDPDAAEGALKRGNQWLLLRMGFAAFAAMNMMWISIALYAGADRGEFRDLFHWIGLAIATPTLLFSGYPFFQGAWYGLRNGALTMDLPIALGATMTYGYSFVVTLGLVPGGDVYWDTVVNFLFVILVGRYLEAISKRRAVASTQRLLDLQPKVATVLRDDDEAVVPIRAVLAGELVLVRPGERIPVDGRVVDGNSGVDESMLSGESDAVQKSPGSAVSAGTINGAGVLRIEVEHLLGDTALGRIIRLVEDAQASKAPIQRLADRVVPWFVALTLGLAAVAFALWLPHDFETALMASTAVLIITCPCAFGLATPMAIAVASGLGARLGILVKNGAVLESLSSIDHFVFDKTGTLTEGRTSVLALGVGAGPPGALSDIDLDLQLRDDLARVAALENLSEHPLARALVAYVEEIGVAWKGRPVSDLEVVPGCGIRAQVDGVPLIIGSREWVSGQGVVEPVAGEQATDAGQGHVYALVGQRLLSFGFDDPVREGAASVVERLRSEGIRVTMLSGDRRAAAERIAAGLGAIDVIAEVLPEDKDRAIAALQRDGHRVAMVGDGVNDAPALVRADVGMALGSGTDVSIASADIVLMSNNLVHVLDAARLSRATLRAIRQNIAISITYNLVMVPLAMAALVTPLIAAISMPLSSLAVITNSARIRRLFRELD